jgi:hypothetical protein
MLRTQVLVVDELIELRGPTCAIVTKKSCQETSAAAVICSHAA